jgi:hypothetical protein
MFYCVLLGLGKVARQFDPEVFDPSKLTVRYRGNSDFVNSQTIEELFPRTYTLTHSDVTRELFLSIGPSYDSSQVCSTAILSQTINL